MESLHLSSSNEIHECSFYSKLLKERKKGKKKMIFILWGVFLLTNKQTFLGPLGFFIWSLLLILALLSILLNATSVYGKHGDFCFFRRVCFLRYGVMYLMRTEQTNWQKGDCFLFFSSVCFDSLLSSYQLIWFFLLFSSFLNSQQVSCFFFFEGRLRECQFSVFELLIFFFVSLFLVSWKIIDY